MYLVLYPRYSTYVFGWYGLSGVRVFRRVYDRGPSISLATGREGSRSERSHQPAGISPQERLSDRLLAEYQQHRHAILVSDYMDDQWGRWGRGPAKIWLGEPRAR